MRIESGALQAVFSCSLLISGTLSFTIIGPGKSPLLLRRARRPYVDDPEDEEKIHQEWLQSEERFSPQWLQKDIDKSKLPPNLSSPAAPVNGDTTTGGSSTPPVNGSTGTPGGAQQNPAASTAGPQIGMVEAAFNAQRGGGNPGQGPPPPNDPSVDRFSPDWLQNPQPPIGTAPIGTTPPAATNTPPPNTGGQQQQQQQQQSNTPDQPPQQQKQQMTPPPPEDRFSPAWLQKPAEPAHGSNPGMPPPPSDRFSPDWMRQPFEEGPPDMMDPMMMMDDDGPLRADKKGAKDWSVPSSGSGGQVASAMGFDDFEAFAMNQSGMQPQGGMMGPPPPQGGMMPPPPPGRGAVPPSQGGMMPPPGAMQPPGMSQPGMDPMQQQQQGGMMQPPPGAQQGGFPGGQQQPPGAGMMQPPGPGINTFPSQPELASPVSDQLAQDMVKQFEASLARLDKQANAKLGKKVDDVKEKKKKSTVVPPEDKAKAQTVVPPQADKPKQNVQTAVPPPAEKQKAEEEVTAVAKKTPVNQTDTTNATAMEKNATFIPRAAKAAAVKQEKPQRNLTLFQEHLELRKAWDKTPQKREAEQEEKRQQAELKRKYEETLKEVKLTYEQGLKQCTQAKLARFQELDDEMPKTTDLAVGIAKMGQAIRKMKDGNKEKEKLEAELLIWQDQYDRTSEEEAKKRQ